MDSTYQYGYVLHTSIGGKSRSIWFYVQILRIYLYMSYILALEGKKNHCTCNFCAYTCICGAYWCEFVMHTCIYESCVSQCMDVCFCLCVCAFACTNTHTYCVRDFVHMCLLQYATSIYVTSIYVSTHATSIYVSTHASTRVLCAPCVMHV